MILNASNCSRTWLYLICFIFHMWSQKLVWNLCQLTIHLILKPDGSFLYLLCSFIYLIILLIHQFFKPILESFIIILCNAFPFDVFIYLMYLLFTCFFNYVFIKTSNNLLNSFIITSEIKNLLLKLCNFWKCSIIEVFEIWILSEPLKMSPYFFCIWLVKFLTYFHSKIF
jgi:hypothetical protein